MDSAWGWWGGVGVEVYFVLSPQYSASVTLCDTGTLSEFQGLGKKSRDFTIHLSPQCGASSGALLDKKSIVPALPR